MALANIWARLRAQAGDVAAPAPAEPPPLACPLGVGILCCDRWAMQRGSAVSAGSYFAGGGVPTRRVGRLCS